MILRVGWSSWELKIDPKRVEEEKEHVLEGSMSQRRSQESSKRSPRWSLGSREAPKRPPRASQRSPRASEEALKSTQKEPNSHPKHSRKHGRINNVDSSEFVECSAKTDDFEGQRVILGAQNRPREGRRGEQTRLRRRYEPQKVSREPQEEPKMVSWS